MSEFNEYTRWDESHTASIHIDYQDYPSDVVQLERENLGFSVITSEQTVADLFGVDVNEDVSAQNRAIFEAIQIGDHIFYLDFCEHSAYSCSLREHSFTNCAGVLIVHRGNWLNAMRGRTFARTYVAKVLHDALDEWMDAVLNGWVYEAIIHDRAHDECYSMGNFLSPEEALKEAMTEHPHIKYSNADFEEERLYTLKAA